MNSHITKVTAFFIAGILLPFSAFAEVSSLAFTSPNQLELVSRQTITIQSQNELGIKENVTQTTCLEIRTTSSSGKLFSSINSADPVSVLILTMNKNSANRNFYYEENQSGNYIFNLKATYRPEEEKRTCSNWPTGEWKNFWTASQNFSVGSGSGGQEETQSQTQSSVQPVSSVGSTWPIEPQVFANAGPDKIAIVGADVVFEGKALGVEGKSLENARYVWNFGDGSTKEGQSVSHVYKYPGEYTVILDVSSGYFSGSDRAKITAEESKIFISSIGDGVKNYIELTNGSKYETDLSAWILKSGTTTFYLPARTYIGGNKKLIIPAESSGIAVVFPSDTKLLYPNGTLATQYSNSKQVVMNTETKNPTSNKTPEITVSSSEANSEQKAPISENVATVILSENKGQANSVIPKNYNWLFGILGVIAVSFIGVSFISRNNLSDSKNKKLSAKDFKIIEE